MKSVSVKIFKITAIIAAVILIFYMVIFKLTVSDYWLFFTDKRTAKIEEIFGFDVTDDVDLKRYIKYADSITSGFYLEFELNGSFEEFMEKSCHGEIIAWKEDGIKKYSDGRTSEFGQFSEIKSCDGYYYYEYGLKYFDVKFYRCENGYRAEISYL